MDPLTLRETIRVVHGRLPLLAWHLERLAEGGVRAEELRPVEAAAIVATRQAPAAALKLQVVVAPGGRVSVHASSEASSLDVPGGPAIVPVTVRALPTLPPHAAKPADRGYWDGPQRLAHLRGGDQAVLVAPDGAVVDGGTATVWAVLGDVLVTPPAPPAIAGVARRLILRELAPLLGLATEVRPLPLEELLSAEETLLSNAVGGIVAARGRGGPVASELAAAWLRALQMPR
jgi:branched-subunit amino acid aminotransferase/4-amino-4-deoxychorismate lyase